MDSTYSWNWQIVVDPATLEALWIGVRFTLIVSFISLLAGTIIGLATAIARLTAIPGLRQVIRVYVDFFRTTPELVQLIWVFYVLPILLGTPLSAMTAGLIALSLNSGAFLSEIFRAGLVSIQPGQTHAAQVLGMTKWQTMMSVILPQAIRRVLPPTGNVFIALIKNSSLLSVIAVSELTYEMQLRVNISYRPLELYTALAVVYFILTYPLSIGFNRLEAKFRVT